MRGYSNVETIDTSSRQDRKRKVHDFKREEKKIQCVLSSTYQVFFALLFFTSFKFSRHCKRAVYKVSGKRGSHSFYIPVCAFYRETVRVVL